MVSELSQPSYRRSWDAVAAPMLARIRAAARPQLPALCCRLSSCTSQLAQAQQLCLLDPAYLDLLGVPLSPQGPPAAYSGHPLVALVVSVVSDVLTLHWSRSYKQQGLGLGLGGLSVSPVEARVAQADTALLLAALAELLSPAPAVFGAVLCRALESLLAAQSVDEEEDESNKHWHSAEQLVGELLVECWTDKTTVLSRLIARCMGRGDVVPQIDATKPSSAACRAVHDILLTCHMLGIEQSWLLETLSTAASGSIRQRVFAVVFLEALCIDVLRDCSHAWFLEGLARRPLPLAISLACLTRAASDRHKAYK